MFTSSNDRIIWFDERWGKTLMKILPIIKRIIKPSRKISESVTVAKPISLASQPEIKQEKNPFLEYIYDMYEKDGVSKDVVDRIVLGGERQRYYRYVGKDELQKLLSGQHVTSSRLCHHGNLTDVTSDPNYGKIPTIGKYRLTFKDKSEFSPYPLGKDKNSRIIEHDLKDSEYYLCGGYDISDIEKIEKKSEDGSFHLLNLFG